MRVWTGRENWIPSSAQHASLPARSIDALPARHRVAVSDRDDSRGECLQVLSPTLTCVPDVRTPHAGLASRGARLFSPSSPFPGVPARVHIEALSRSLIRAPRRIPASLNSPTPNVYFASQELVSHMMHARSRRDVGLAAQSLVPSSRRQRDGASIRLAAASPTLGAYPCVDVSCRKWSRGYSPPR